MKNDPKFTLHSQRIIQTTFNKNIARPLFSARKTKKFVLQKRTKDFKKFTKQTNNAKNA